MLQATLSGRTLAIFSAGMGLRNTRVAPTASKGVTEVKIGGEEVVGWTQSWLLEGEEKRVYDPQANGSAVAWVPYTQAFACATKVWLKGVFAIPRANLVRGEVSYALELSSMWKGVAYENRENLGPRAKRPKLATGIPLTSNRRNSSRVLRALCALRRFFSKIREKKWKNPHLKILEKSAFENFGKISRYIFRYII